MRNLLSAGVQPNIGIDRMVGIGRINYKII